MSKAHIEKEISVACSIAHAFDVFTRQIHLWWPTHHRRLPGSKIVLEARRDGRFYETRDSETFPLGHVLIYAPPDHLRFTWELGRSAVGPTLVDIYFQEEGDATIVRVVHSEGESALGPDWESRAARFQNGWHAVFSAFLEYLKESK